MMVGGDAEDSRPVDEWPPSASLDLTNKDVTSSRLVLLTYVEEDPSAMLAHGLEGFSELEQQSSGVVSGSTVVSPLDPNMGSTACYSPVYRPSSPLIPAPVSPTGGFLNPSSPGQIRSAVLQEPSMIVLGDPCQFTTGDNYVIANMQPFSQSVDQVQSATGDEGKLLLLSTGDSNQAEVLVAGDEGCQVEGQKVEVLFSNTTITYMHTSESDGPRFIQIPREYVVTSHPGHSSELATSNETAELTSVQVDSNDSENSNLRMFFSSLKDSEIILEPAELRLEPAELRLEPAELRLEPGIDIESGTEGAQLVDISLLQQTTAMPLLQAAPTTTTTLHRPLSKPPQLFPAPRGLPATVPAAPPLKRYWCEECKMLLPSGCREHTVERKICDKPVPSRARATLPAAYLSINKVPDCEEYGVFARKSISKRSQFGPIEGVILQPDEVMLLQEAPHLELTIETETGEMRTLDVSNEHMSNWMRFVRLATPHNPPNLLLSQLGASLFFTTSRTIPARQELLVWYSPAYAARRNLPVNPPTPVWTCATCKAELLSSEDLTSHSLQHSKERMEYERLHPQPVEPPLSVPPATSRNTETLTVDILRQKNQALVASVDKDFSDDQEKRRQYECVVCQKRFIQRCHLRRHILIIHSKEKKWFCKVCRIGFADSFNRLRHLRKSHPNVKGVPKVKTANQRYITYSCNVCGLTFIGMRLLNLHMHVHRNNYIDEATNHSSEDHMTVESCPQCCQSFSDRMQLVLHVAEHGTPRNAANKRAHPFHCKVCNRNFKSLIRYKIHSDTHKEDVNKPLQCPICFKRFMNKSALQCHDKIHKGYWECPICKRNFTHMLAMREHVKVHAVGGNYPCPQCDKVFSEYINVRKHIRAFHSKKSFTCTQCNTHYNTEYKLRSHQLRHTDTKQFMCDSCGKLFKRKDKLNEHKKKLHTNEELEEGSPPPPPEEKITITRAAANSSDYERYIYKCHQCMLGFKRRGMLVNHMANRHPEVPPDTVPELNLPILRTTREYFCQYCQKTYKSSSKRKAHILKNHPGLELPMSNRQKIPGVPNPTFSQPLGSVPTNPHSCTWCHKQYASKAKLLQHQRKKHFAQLPQSEQLKAQSQHLKNLSVEEFLDDGEEIKFQNGKFMRTIRLEDIIDNETTPVALCTNLSLSQAMPLTTEDYEVIELEDDANGVTVENTLLNRRSSFKQSDNISSDLLSQAMSEIGVAWSDLKVLSSDHCFKLLQSQGGIDSGLYTPYPAR